MLKIFHTILTVLTLSSLAAAKTFAQPNGNKRPNIVIVLADDQGWGDLSINGNTNLQTPNIDAIGQAGASFSNFYVSPVCSPTRAELLTGRYHARSGVYSTSSGGARMNLDETTIAEVFKAAGYATGIFGKWHNGTQPPYHPNARGFDEFYGFTSGHWGDYFSPQLLDHNGKVVKGEGYLPNDLTNRSLAFIEHNQQQPFLAYVAYNIPHSPMQVPDRWWKRFKDKQLQMRNRDPDRENLKFTKAALAMVENIDWNVGRIMSRLKELDIADNTIVVYFSDNGPNSWRWNGGMKGKKGDVSEGGVRSPLLVQWPEHVSAGQNITKISAAIDLLPTLAELAGISYNDKINKPLDGKSLQPLLLNGNGTEWSERLLYSSWKDRSSVRSQKYRLNNNGPLYNIAEDPGQRKDISDKKPKVAQSLKDSLTSWNKRVMNQAGQNTDRPFPIGYAGFKYTQLPARDGTSHGNIERSNRFPNASFFTNWVSTADSISWDVEVLEAGTYEVELYYTCAPEDLGSIIQFSFGSASVTDTIRQSNDPTLRGMGRDRVERVESYVKEFRPLELGTITLPEGRGPMVLRALDIPSHEVMDVRMLHLKKVTK